MTTTPREDAPLASPAMTAWCADFDICAFALYQAAYRHAAGDHSACAYVIGALLDYFADVGLSVREAEMLGAGFTDAAKEGV